MKDEELINFFSSGLNKINDKFGDKVKSIPIYGPVVYLFLDTFVDSIDSFVLDSFKKVYDEKVDFILEPITNATNRRVDIFFKKFEDLLSEDFNSELSRKEYHDLKKAYNVLYRILVLKDAVLIFVYADLISTGQWREIVTDYYKENGMLDTFFTLAQDFITSFENKKVIFEYEDFMKEFLSKGSDNLKNNPEIKDQLKDIVWRIFGRKNDKD